MAISVGQRLATYEVLSLLGKGGMGEVYRARDTKLDRDVAIKTLPEEFAQDSDRTARFEREAKLLASVNHPNIGAIHGIDEAHGIRFLVLELIEGETLADKIAHGPIPVDEALNISLQIAEALEAAHEKGILHRDLKPANIKVTPDGNVKVLDFGLAKAFGNEQTNSTFSNSPTLTLAATHPGVILGTAAYMSPEQARGKPVTKATDIWAYGCVVYEMLTGKKAFEGDDITEILASVVKGEPDWNLLPGGTPPAMRTLLRKCLRKDKRQRLADAGTVRIEIEDAVSGRGFVEITPFQGSDSHGRRAVAWSLVGLLAGSLMTLLAVWSFKQAPSVPPQLIRFTITLPPGDRLAPMDRAVLAISPDGRQLAYVALSGGTQRIYLRTMDGLEARAISGTDGARSVFFSPDSRWVGFDARGALRKVPVTGGAVTALANAPNTHGFVWGNEGAIVFQPEQGSSLYQVSDSGGDVPETLTRLESGDIGHRWPEFLPGGNALLFVADGTENRQIAVHSIDSGVRRNLKQNGTQPRYASSGHLLYMQAGTMMAVPFDAQSLQVSGTAIPVVENIAEHGREGTAQYAVSSTGVLAYVSGGVLGTKRNTGVGQSRWHQGAAHRRSSGLLRDTTNLPRWPAASFGCRTREP